MLRIRLRRSAIPAAWGLAVTEVCLAAGAFEGADPDEAGALLTTASDV